MRRRDRFYTVVDFVGTASIVAVILMIIIPFLGMEEQSYWHWFACAVIAGLVLAAWDWWGLRIENRKRKREAMPTHDDI